MKYLKTEHILRIHERLVATSGGDPGVRDLNAVESSVAQPQMTFDGKSLYPTLVEKAVALGFSLNKNHAFVDGNERTAHATVEMFLIRNGWEIEATVDEQEQVYLGVAAGSLTREEYISWLRDHLVKRKGSSKHSHY